MNFSSLFLKNPADAIFFSHSCSVGYITGFWGSFGRVLLLKNGTIILFSDARYSGSAKRLCQQKGLVYQEVKKDDDFWEKTLKKHGIGSLFIESEYTSLAQYKAIKKSFGKTVKIKPKTNILENLRAVKSEKEIALLQKSATINDSALQKTLLYLKNDITEQEVAWIFERIAREEEGAESLSFAPIIAFGKNSAVPHHSPTAQKLLPNTPILCDIGVVKEKYCSDMTRCFFYGKPSEEWKNAYELVLKAQETGIQAIKPNVLASAVDKAARDIFKEEEKLFSHSFGHGVGIEIHEFPSISAKSSAVLQEKMVITAEPGLYYSGKFGIRIEDLLVIENGKPKLLSYFPKSLTAALSFGL